MNFLTRLFYGNGHPLITSTNWTELGYPILDETVDFPYEPRNEKDSIFWEKYSEGPIGLNKGDIIRLELSTSILNINGEWIGVGVDTEKGPNLKLKKEVVDLCNLRGLEAVKFPSIKKAEQFLRKESYELKIQRKIASNERVIWYFKKMVGFLEMKVSKDGTQIEKAIENAPTLVRKGSAVSSTKTLCVTMK